MTAPPLFHEAAAAAYDRRFEKLVAMQDALHLVTRLALSELRRDGAPRGADPLRASASCTRRTSVMDAGVKLAIVRLAS